MLGVSWRRPSPGALLRSTRERFDGQSDSSAFAALWALATLIHQTNNGGQGFASPPGWVLVAASVAVLLRPASPSRLALFAIFQIIELIWVSPFAADHQLLVGLVNLVIVIRLVTTGLPGTDPLMPIKGAAQSILLVAYSAAALSKYNSTFLDPTLSCAVQLADQATFGIAGLNPFDEFHIALTLIAETSIPLLLLIRRTRIVGVFVGISFHLLVSGSPALMVEDFTFTLVALFALFLPRGSLEELGRRASRTLGRSRVASDQRRLPEALRLLLYVGLASTSVLFESSNLILWFVCLVVGLWVLVNLWLIVPPTVVGGELNRPSSAGIAPLLLVSALLVSPYLGFRTTGVFTMFSNLRTEGPGTNHFFLPSLHLVDYQNDLAEPAAGSSSHFDLLIEEGQQIPYVEVRRTGAGDDSFLFVGERANLPAVESGSEIRRLGTVERKVLQFRPVPGSGPPVCSN